MSATHLRLKGKVALITGAASGFGRATAAKFVSHGAKVILADVQPRQGRLAAEQLGPAAAFVLCDVTRESDLSAAVDAAVSRHGRLDVMFNNAGVPCQTAPSIADLDLAAFDRAVAINLRGAVAGIKHAARAMIPRRSGCILCTGSVAGLMGGLAQHAYSTTKFAVAGIVKSAAAELCRHGIRVNCVSPFCVATPFVMKEMREMYPGVGDEGIVEMLHNAGELKGADCEPEDVANAALFLASDEAKYVSGHNLVVDGGFTAFKNLRLPPIDQAK